MEKIKGIKAFDKDLKCRDFQYEVGKSYSTDKAKACETGYHFCENSLDTLNFYPLIDIDGKLTRFAEVIGSGEIDRHENNKVAVTNIEIIKEIQLKDFVNNGVQFLLENNKEGVNSEDYSKLAASGDNSQLAASGYNSQLAASGDYSQLAVSGYNSQLAASGDYSQLAVSGYKSQLAASGDYSKLAASGYNSQLAASGYNSKLAASGYKSQLAASGDNSKLAASGDNSKLAASGDNSKLAASGDNSKLAASGYNSQLAASGEDSVIANIGIGGSAKGVIGTWITLAEYDESYKPICVKSTQIDGVELKGNVYYKLKGGEFVES